MPGSITIQKKPVLPQSSDYNFLRQKGLDYIEQLGSKLWTDYNIHDPGITLLEALSYAITDLGYRTSLNLKDLLAPAVNRLEKLQSGPGWTAQCQDQRSVADLFSLEGGQIL